MLGPVSAGMGDCLRAGKPSQYVINHLGQLTFPFLWGNRVPACLAGVKAGRVHLCRVAGVIPYGKWCTVALRSVNTDLYAPPTCFTFNNYVNYGELRQQSRFLRHCGPQSSFSQNQKLGNGHLPPTILYLKTVKADYSSLWESITELRGVTCHMGSHSVTCHPTQVNAPHHNPSQPGRYSIYLPRREGSLSWPR